MKAHIKKQLEQIFHQEDDIIWDEQAEFCNDYCCTVQDNETVKKYVINFFGEKE